MENRLKVKFESLIQCSQIRLSEDLILYVHLYKISLSDSPPEHGSTVTCPSIAVLLAHISSLLQQNPGAVQVAQRDSQVERGPTTRVQALQVALNDRVSAQKKTRLKKQSVRRTRSSRATKVGNSNIS